MATQVIAHRGASGTAPENTLAAFGRAAAVGADMIELDVQLTRDGVVIVLHDDRVDRTTDGRGRAAELDWRAIAALDAGSWFAPQFRGERIPMLAEVLEAIALPINVELKAGGGEALAERVVAEVRSVGAMGRVVFSSFDDDALSRIRRLAPEADLAVLRARGTIGRALTVARRVRATALHIRNAGWWLRELVDAATGEHKIRVWTVNVYEEWMPFEAAGATGVFTDYPERFLHKYTA